MGRLSRTCPAAQSKMGKGYILTVDAVMALIIVMLLFILIVGMQGSMKNTESTEFERLHYISEDVIEALNREGVLDQICTGWALSGGDEASASWADARFIANKSLSSLIPENIGYSLLIDGKELYNNSDTTPPGDASTLTHSTRTISGYMQGSPVDGYVARAYTSTNSSGYGKAMKNDEGCTWTVQFETAPSANIKVPGNYSGTKNCNYMTGTYDAQSAVDDAAYRLFSLYDNPHNGMLDTVIGQGAMRVESASVGYVRSTWSPAEVKLVLWMK
jgi:hypothetical protein